MLTLDNDLTDRMYHLAPHKNTFAMDKPREVSDNLCISKTVVGTIANFLDREDNRVPTELQSTFMKQLAI
mgnify:CR=1 FL=1